MLLQARGIVHAYAGKRALDGVDFTLRAGEVHALMGQNGAGKSTLIKVLTGAAPLQAGQISLAGQSIRPTSTQDAQRLGISTVYQEVNLCGNLSVAENIFAGRQPLRRWTRGGGIDWRGLNQRARTLLAGLDVDVDVRRELASLPVAVQQMVAIARAIDISARVLILDEPTSSLDSDEVEKLFSAMRRLRDSGMAILFVTHFLDQVYAVSRSNHRAAQRPARGRIPGPDARPCRAGRGHGGAYLIPRSRNRKRHAGGSRYPRSAARVWHAQSRAPRQRFVGESGDQARRDPRARRLVRLRPHGGRAAAVRTRSRRRGRDPCERATCLARAIRRRPSRITSRSARKSARPRASSKISRFATTSC